jgi:hypothetical protein
VARRRSRVSSPRLLWAVRSPPDDRSAVLLRTRALLGAVIGPVRGEVSQALQLVGRLSKDMLVLADRGFDANAFIRAVHQAQAALVLRVCSSRKPTVLRVLHDGSYLSVIAGIPVRIITATVVVTCADDVVARTHAGRARVRNLQDSRSLLRLDTL